MTYPEIQPEDCQHRSFVYRKLAKVPVTWSEVNGYAVALSIHDFDAERAYAQKMALCDLSHLQRIGFKGKGTNEWLVKQGIKAPDNINAAAVSSSGYLVAKLGAEDILILDHPINSTNIKPALEQQWLNDCNQDSHSCSTITPRQDSHACFYISGIHAPEMFATMCAIDLRAHKFDNLSIAQTSLARINAIIIRNDIGKTPAYYVLVENVSAEYCWDCIQDAMQEHSGQLIGIACLKELLS